MRRDQLFHAVYQALDAERCGICAQALNGVQRFLDSFMYERVTDSWTREEFIRARGFCNTHAWQLARGLTNASGLTILYHHLLHDFVEAYRRMVAAAPVSPAGRSMAALFGGRPEPRAREIGDWLAPRASCPACADQRETESRYAWAAAHALSDPDFRARYETSLGFCLRHLTKVLELATSAPDVEWLTAAEQRIAESLLQDLSEFWRKHDYRFHHEPISTGEATSWTRVLHKWTGAPGLVWPEQAPRG
ncbi:MAG: DUF6062 family protein [Armatimonadota bacterium]|nr:DUF6062 family protein [Armatimonadota bacterium]